MIREFRDGEASHGFYASLETTMFYFREYKAMRTSAFWQLCDGWVLT